MAKWYYAGTANMALQRAMVPLIPFFALDLISTAHRCMYGCIARPVATDSLVQRRNRAELPDTETPPMIDEIP